MTSVDRDFDDEAAISELTSIMKEVGRRKECEVQIKAELLDLSARPSYFPRDLYVNY